MAPGLWCRDYRGARLDEMKPLHDSSQSLTLLYLLAQGRGGDALGSLDSLVNRLLQYLGAKEITDGSASNVDITAPGAIIALALISQGGPKNTESDVIFSKLSVPQTHYEFGCVRPDFIMLRVIARNLIMWSRIRPTCDWIQSQVPEVVRNGSSLQGEALSPIRPLGIIIFSFDEFSI
ncbi:hypothetical protein F2Q68_00004226 [Brassica cretica]|uniref:Anaphase-promoting complex subunit 1 n=2 Tax=Brassica cretica TaxID=69181 RepID=A0ABQ7CJ88_BRACR|nr:hypothetical protein F2Q68_00004226 [Brassica cretica]KAF3552264.1 hypothetical protein DY000_02000231 [Brassica cretica]